VQKFIQENFAHCECRDLARLCDEVKPGSGLSIRLDEFEKTFFPLSDSVKRRFPFYAHVSISTYGLRFEFPEHHFLREIETSLPELLDTLARLTPFMKATSGTRRDSNVVAGLLSREKFLCRKLLLIRLLRPASCCFSEAEFRIFNHLILIPLPRARVRARGVRPTPIL
jgi:hypothetical protein